MSVDARFGLMFHGRADRQVKVSGYRVELQEVEGVIRRTVGCNTVAVIPFLGGDGICTHLVAFCDSTSAAGTVAKEAYAKELPSYMIPAQFIFTDAFPYNTNGKLDYKELASRLHDRRKS